MSKGTIQLTTDRLVLRRHMMEDALLLHQNFGLDPETDSIEVGCSIERKSWGNGFAGEALRAVIRYLTEQEGIRCVKAWCAADNVGSRKVMERVGMTRVSTEKGALVIDGREYDKQNYEVLL